MSQEAGLIIGPAFIAAGTIPPARIVKQDTTVDDGVVVATDATVAVIGVSQEGQYGPPGVVGSDTAVAASSGQQIQIITNGNVALVEAGGTVTQGDPIEASTGGVGILATGAGQHYIVGKALKSATVGAWFPVYVDCQQITL